MQTGAITTYIDVGQVALYVFWVFFAFLIFYLRREDKREGYPLVSERSDFIRVQGFPGIPKPKKFLLPHGGVVYAPRDETAQPGFDAMPMATFPGAPLAPIGNPLLARVGPGASALRADTPDLTNDTAIPRVVPLRVATDHYPDPEGPDPIGMEVVGADGLVAGVVAELWVDIAETMVRYLEVTLTAGHSVLVPLPLAKINSTTRRFTVVTLMAAQFAEAPVLASPDQVTLREEDRIQAFFASGQLFATPERSEPLL